ncbi:MAG: efflux RND transporter periplasmic adaptor subunit [Planctomycetota bacterium]
MRLLPPPTDPSSPSRLAACCLLCLCVAADVAAQPPADEEAAPPPVEVARLVDDEVAENVQFVGVAEPSRRSTVGSPLDGRVLGWEVDAGQRVKEGDVLARLRTRALELQLAAAKAELTSRRAALEELKAGARPGEIAAARASEAAAKAAAEFAETNFQRTERLMRQSGASKLEYDQARRQRDESKQVLINAQSTTQLLVDGPRSERIVAAEALVELQQQTVAGIEDRIERSQIRAPFDGVVVAEFTEAGNWLSAGDPVAEIIALNPVEIRVFVPERYINRVRVGESCEVTLRATAGASWIGRVRYIVPQAEQPARTFPVIVEVENTLMSASGADENVAARYAISAGMLASVNLPIGEAVRKRVVHKDALRLGGATPSIVVIENVKENNGTARRIPVRVDGTSGNRVAIVAAVSGQPLPSSGTLVATRGNESLTDGQKVEILPAGETGDETQLNPDVQ